MQVPKIIFVERSKDNTQRKSSAEHKAIFNQLILDLTEAYPHLKSTQVKAMAVEKFLHGAGIVDVSCLESYENGSYGVGIFNKDTKEKIAFIKTNSFVVNVLNDLYNDGVFDSVLRQKV